MCRILLGNFLPFHGSPKSREGVGSRTMKTISSCPADSVQPPTDYGSSDCKPKSERWISQRCSARPRSIDLLNGHPYVLPPVCVLFSSSWEKWLPHAITQCQMLCLLSPLSSDYSLANKKYRTPKKAPQNRKRDFFRAYTLTAFIKACWPLLATGDAQIPVFTTFSMLLVWWKPSVRCDAWHWWCCPKLRDHHNYLFKNGLEDLPKKSISKLLLF